MLFPSLEIEGEVQVKDRTRMSGVKSYVSKGASAIAAMTITPGRDGSPVSVYDADQDLRYLDWEFADWNGDITPTNKYIDFSEGGTIFEAVLTEGTYTLAQLATEIQTQLNAEGSNTYTVTVLAGDKLKISADGAFALLPESGDNAENGILKHIGFDLDTADTVTEITGKRVEYLQKLITIIALDATTPTPNSTTVTKLIKVFSEAGDTLFSGDEDLTAKEPQILNWVDPGRNTFKNVHRRAQKDILAYLDEEGYEDIYNKPYTKASIVHTEELNQWATYMTLRMIFEGIHNSRDDVFAEKAKTYLSHELKARHRSILRIDIDGDGKVDITEGLGSFQGGRLSRR